MKFSIQKRVTPYSYINFSRIFQRKIFYREASRSYIMRVILILLFFSVFLVLTFSVKSDWLKKLIFFDTLAANLIQKLNKHFQILAQEISEIKLEYTPHFFPRFPQRLAYLVSEIEISSEKLIRSSEELNEKLKESDCKFAFSQCLPKITFGGIGCQPGQVFGLPYQNINEIEEKKNEIADQIDNLSFLRELLKTEMEGGLSKELETLRPEMAEELKNNLDKTLDESGEIIEKAKENQELYNINPIGKCKAECQPGPVCGIRACAQLGSGPQKHIEIKANISVSLDDLDLGEVGIDKFGLALPDKLKFPQLGDIILNIPPQTLQVCVPLQPIPFSVDPPSLPPLPFLSFTCPTLPNLPTTYEIDPGLKLPKEIKIPFPEIPEIKWCPIPEISGGFEVLERIRQELIAVGEKEMEEIENKIDQEINKINEQLKKEIQSAKPKDISMMSEKFSYRSFQSLVTLTTDQSEETGNNEINWHLQIFSWLAEKCQELPGITSDTGPTEKARDCFDSKKLLSTIVEQCNKIWAIHCTGLVPPDCNSVKYQCEQQGKIAAGKQCQDFFKERNKPIPDSCQYEVKEDLGIITFSPNFNAVLSIKAECSEVLKELLDRLLIEERIDHSTYSFCSQTIATLGPESLKVCTDLLDQRGIKVNLPQPCLIFDPLIILPACDELWPIACNTKDKPFPEICKDIRFSCEENGKRAATLRCKELCCQEFKEECEHEGKAAAVTQCQNLFKERDKEVPVACQNEPIKTIKSECSQILKDILDKLLFDQKIDYTTYSRCLESIETFGSGSLTTCIYLLAKKEINVHLPQTCIAFDPMPIDIDFCLVTPDCIFQPIETLEKKCDELKKQEKEPHKSCKLLPLFTGQIEAPGVETYVGSKITSPGRTLLNVPFGFGGGIGFNCPIGVPSLPKIILPDIVLPDIRLPKFSLRPFLEIKLPSIILEDIILPDIELCDLNDCANIFPSLYFTAPILKLPSFAISIPIPQLPGLELRTRIDMPVINFSLPQINFFNLTLPELKLPTISLPSPKIDFNITDIDFSAIFELIFTFILNALDIPDFGGCLEFKIPTTFLSITFPDYYFSFKKFPEIPKIPFCEDVNEFCKKVKNALGQGGWLKKAREIEEEFSKTVDKIQRELDKVSDAAGYIQLVIEEVAKDVYGKAIYDAIVEQLAAKGLSLEDYINPKTKEIDLSKVPFPGVFPISTPDQRECLFVSTPQVSITLKIGNYPEKKIEKLSPTQYTIYAPINIPLEVPIPWPERLKKIELINSLTYKLPKIPLSALEYEKEFPIKTVGFQPRTFTFDFGKPNEGDCIAKEPSGGNPFPIFQISGKIEEMKDIKNTIDDTSQKVIDILR